MWWASGGRTCCTTRARCGSRAGCCSSRASWSPACRGSSPPPPLRTWTASTRTWPAVRRAARAPGAPTARAYRRRAASSRPPANGGHCVARESGLVVFVRHALPGERVLAEVTEVHRGYLRADAVRVLAASPDRVAAPCPYAHPDGCGGCDLQHVTAGGQREWKA